MNRWSLNVLVLVGVIGPVIASRALAQTAGGTVATTARPEPAQLVSLKFPGGTLGDYLKVVRESARDVNVVLSTPDAATIPLPPIQLQGVDVASAVQLLEGEYPISNEGGFEVGVRFIAPTAEGGKPVYQITARKRGRLAAASGEVQVWSVADLVGGPYPGEAVLTAVETALGLLGDSGRPAQVRFHESSSLLVVMGDPRQLDAVHRVIRELREGLARKPQSGDPAETIAGLFDWIAHMKELDSAQVVAENAKLRDELQQSQKRIQELEQRSGKSSRP